MKVHRCPHCGKPYLESEARAGKCPVCQEPVSGAAPPEAERKPASTPKPSPAPAPKAKEKAKAKPAPAPKPKAKEKAKAKPAPAPIKELEPIPEAEPARTAKPAAALAAAPSPAPAAPDPPLPDQPKPHRSTSVAVPFLLLVILAGAILWWMQARDLTARVTALEDRLEGSADAVEAAEQRAAEAERARIATEKSVAAFLNQSVDKETLAARMKAAIALLKTDPAHQPSRASVLTGLQQDASWIGPLSELTPPPQWAVPAALGMLDAPDPETRRLAAEALGRIRPPGPIVLSLLDKATRDPDPRVRKAVTEALQKIRSNP